MSSPGPVVPRIVGRRNKPGGRARDRRVRCRPGRISEVTIVNHRREVPKRVEGHFFLEVVGRLAAKPHTAAVAGEIGIVDGEGLERCLKRTRVVEEGIGLSLVDATNAAIVGAPKELIRRVRVVDRRQVRVGGKVTGPRRDAVEHLNERRQPTVRRQRIVDARRAGDAPVRAASAVEVRRVRVHERVVVARGRLPHALKA